MRRVLETSAIALLTTALSALQPVAAQQAGSGSSRTTPPPKTAQPKTPDEFYQSFWTYLHRPESPYKSWPGSEGLRKGEGPHTPLIKNYVNKLVAENPQALPNSSVLVAENYADDGKTVQSITAMLRVQGSDPQHFDWYWLEYQPDGSISRTSQAEGKKAIAGKVASCIDCHAKAKGGDFVFSNDGPPPGER